MERVLCDLDGNGNVMAWYVHGPDLCYKVNPTNGLTCYHADAVGNIIALTDGNTNLVAQYAYTPYGRNVGSTTFQFQISNPYLFVGSQGVMEEVPGLYFMRARYYSSDAGAFLSTDPVRKIGPGWTPIVYVYAEANSLSFTDPSGRSSEPFFMAFDAASLNYKAANGTISAEDYASFGAGAVTTVAIVGLAALSAPVAVPLGIVATVVGAIGYYQDSQDPNSLIGGPIKSSIINIFQWAASDPITANGGTVGGSTPMLANGFAKNTLSPNKSPKNPFGLPSTQITSANQTSASKTATVAAPKAAAATVTNPRGASGGGTTTSSGGSGGGGGSTTYTVRAGDTLGNIGSQFGSSATAIGQANGIANLNLIHPGQVLTIPSHR